METSLSGLRYKIKDILLALERNEEITLLYRGKVRGVIMPAENTKKVREHPFFGMKQNSDNTEEILKSLRNSVGKYDNLTDPVGFDDNSGKEMQIA